VNADRRSDLERAYQLTRYEVPALGLVLTIGQTSPVLDQLLCEQGVKAWSFISAANPHSRLASAAINARQHQRLIQRVQTLGFPFFEGVGVAVCARNAEQVASSVAELKSAGVRVTGAAVDITDAAALASWMRPSACRNAELKL